MFDLERKPDRPFPIERAILFSIAAHILAALFFLMMPDRPLPDPRKGLLAAFVPPKPDGPIPVAFKEAPGRERQNPKRSDLSDKDRIAGGGDPSKPRSDTPFVPERSGKEGLAPGAPLVSPPRGTRGAEATEREKTAMKQPGALPNLEQVVADAGRGVAGARGDSGAGLSNPTGGFSDSGPLSFDSSWYDWGPYAAEMVRRIKLHWEVPDLARIGMKGKVTIRFFIRGDGRVEGATILSVSGVPPFDFAAMQSILTSSPFRPLPRDLGSDREGVTVTFFYNLRPEDEQASGGAKGGGKR